MSNYFVLKSFEQNSKDKGNGLLTVSRMSLQNMTATWCQDHEH